MLLELEEEDELAEFAAQAVTSGIRTRPRAFPSSSSHLVEQYVSKMEETVAQRCKVRELLCASLDAWLTGLFAGHARGVQQREEEGG